MDTAGPTRIQAGVERSLVPTGEAGPAAVEAFQRSPTLMAGDTAGAQGQVRIFAPNRRLLWGMFFGSGLGALFVLVVGMAFHNVGSFGYVLVSLIMACAASVAALRRPCYITTDEAGIGITTRRGSQALRWSDIHQMSWVPDYGIVQTSRYELRTPDPVEINLTGYPAALKGELIARIKSRAALQAHPVQKMVFMNRDRPLPLPDALSEGGDEEIRALVMAGQKGEATKLYRKRHGANLKVSLAAIKDLAMNFEVQIPGTLLQKRLPPDPQFRRELENLVASNQQKQACRRYRQMTGASRSQANEVIALLEAAPSLPPGTRMEER